jgi:hypothetical protein
MKEADTMIRIGFHNDVQVTLEFIEETNQSLPVPSAYRVQQCTAIRSDLKCRRGCCDCPFCTIAKSTIVVNG